MTLGTGLLAAALACLGIACVAGVGRAVLGGPVLAAAPASGAPRGPRDAALGRLGAAALLAGLVLLLVALALRAVLAGRAPWGNLVRGVTRPSPPSSSAATFSPARRQPIAGLLPLVAGLAALPARRGHGPAGRHRSRSAPALQAPLLLTVHVGAAIVAYAVAGLAFLAAVGELIQRRRRRWIGFLPAGRGLHATARIGRAGRVPRSSRRHRARLRVGQPRLALVLEQRPEGARGRGHLARLRRIPPCCGRGVASDQAGRLAARR